MPKKRNFNEDKPVKKLKEAHLLSHVTLYLYLGSLDDITLGIGKACALILFTYVGLRITSITYENAWGYLNGFYGQLFIVEFVLFAVAPIMFFYGVQKKSVGVVQFAALGTMIAIILNRLNTVYITFNWQLGHHELFYWKEVIVVISILIIEVLVYRWIVNRMPVLRQHPDYIGEDLIFFFDPRLMFK
ncbi:MAG: hypothetical protein KKA10_12365 [Euryarchaeota archaeon]|nr:hypothetical protein [Euryarchaeota archaeon]MBU4454658.1 hypothetical protein [Euryarchaeota archaeon]MCG2736082.1 hypothetical protein [Candidatus Methanoperedenaceae archaeon]